MRKMPGVMKKEITLSLVRSSPWHPQDLGGSSGPHMLLPEIALLLKSH